MEQIPTYQSFGRNNYSGGMDVITLNPSTVDVEELKKLRAVHLNPFIEPNELEIFALCGTKKQYDDWYKRNLTSFATNRATDVYGLNFDDEDVNKQRSALIEQIKESFIPWYDELCNDLPF